MTLQFVHPSRSKLRAWLTSFAPSDRVTVHVESCDQCAARLVDLAEAEPDDDDVAADDALIAAAVTAEWAPPVDLTERIIRTIDERQHNERDLTAILDLFGVAGATAQLMLPPDTQGPRVDPAGPGGVARDETNGDAIPKPDNESIDESNSEPEREQDTP